MTLRAKLEVLMMEDLLTAQVGDIIATLRQVNRQHALVLKSTPKPKYRRYAASSRSEIGDWGWTSVRRGSRPPRRVGEGGVVL